ncbi:IPT/TIG domain-containing protein [Pyxidicoccus xibeiensis]|uniref:IPT/TIG domain-containing protein n=1 Tax=Pyxidicoccus xibeiensis TaxID=2906759 RepID=UPI0020A74696|nr:IPT/TIG domain-containing protein [Pyxidicoccus xibeiensis]MCP3140398.1 IPT/TIG domain-containing protein [Pyxidicoccus xibeiensis]
MSSRCSRLLLLVLPLLAVACSDDPDGGTPPSGTPPTVREVQPTGGPIAGNTLINVYGSGFQDGAKVFLGEHEVQRTVVVNAFRLYGYTPTATSGRVDVRVVNPGGEYGVLVRGFAFDGPPAPRIDQAGVSGGNRELISGGQPVDALVTGEVNVAGVTRGVGQGGGVLAQVGFAPGEANLLDMASYTWEAATYLEDSNTREADVYQGNVQLQAPIEQERREWAVTLRFSIDGGQTWVLTDGDGMANGLSAQMMRRVFIARPKVDYCKLGPDSNRSSLDLFYKPAETVLLKVVGQVYAAGLTPGSGAGSGVQAQLGFGPPDSDPNDAAVTGWTWVSATYKTDIGNNDEFEAELPNPATLGQYRVAMRFSISKDVWRMCDVDGVNDSLTGELTYSPNKLGILTVANEPPKPAVTWCKIGEDQKNDPEVVNYLTTQTTGFKTVYANVNLPGVTDKPGAGPGLTGQLGWGPKNEDPRTSTVWNWSTQLTWNKDNFSVNDEFKAVLPNPAVNGEYRYAVRFSANGGPVRVCDHNGTDSGNQAFELDKLGVLNVTGEVVLPRVVGYCKLGPDQNNTPESVTYFTTTVPSRKIVGQVYVLGATPGAGAGPGVVGQLGWGLAGTDPATWNWQTAGTYKGEIGSNDEFEATLPNPGTVGSFRFAYRFQANGGAFLYCDADGNSGGETGFEASKTGTLTVEEPAPVVGVCRLQSVSGTTVGSGDAVTAVGRVRIPGVTNGNGAGANLQVQMGVGAADVDASTSATSFTWAPATYSREAEGEADTDEFTLDLRPGYTGSRAVSMRYSTNGTTWFYCDKDGSDVGGYTLGQQHALTVGNHAGIDYCRLQWPLKISDLTGNRTVYGFIFEDGVTNAPPPATTLTAELGYGPKEQDPGVSTAWTWLAGTVQSDTGNDDEYRADMPVTAPVGSSYVWRYRVGTGPYCFGDWQPEGQPGGSANGLSPDTLGTVDQ